MRGYEVELGSVLKRKVRNGRSLAEQLEVSFVTNRLSRRIYVQVADESSGEFGVWAQKAALMAIRDSFKKIIVLGRPIVPTYDEEGIFYIGFFGFFAQAGDVALVASLKSRVVSFVRFCTDVWTTAVYNLRRLEKSEGYRCA